jgi:hypothetical protein
MTAVSLGEPAAAPYGFVSAAVGVGGASAAGTMPRRSATRAVRCTILGVGIARLRSATGAGLLQLSAQIDQRRASHVRDATVPVLLGATIGLLGVVQRAPFLEQDAEIERRGGIAVLIGAPVHRLDLGERPLFNKQRAEIRSLQGLV